MSRSLIPMIVPATAGVGLAAFAVFAEDTGVTRSEGAYLALFGAGAVLAGGIVAGFTERRGMGFGVLAALILLGAALTAIAGFFLMQYPLAVTMGLALLGMVYVLLRPADPRRNTIRRRTVR